MSYVLIVCVGWCSVGGNDSDNDNGEENVAWRKLNCWFDRLIGLVVAMAWRMSRNVIVTLNPLDIFQCVSDTISLSVYQTVYQYQYQYQSSVVIVFATGICFGYAAYAAVLMD